MSRIGDIIRNTKEVILVPEVFDCSSARCAELNGFEVIMISSSDLANSLYGLPDIGLMNFEDVIGAIDRMTNMTNMPIIMDADDGYGRPVTCYYAVKRMAKAGVAGVLITEGAENMKPGVCSPELGVLRMKAARDGLGDDDALLIARCDLNPQTEFNEVVERCNKYLEAGANMTCILNMHRTTCNRTELCRRLADQIPGWKWYPDLTSDADGNPEVALSDIFDMGYRMTGIHYSLHAAMIAMLDTGRHVMKDKDNVYVTKAYDFTGYKCYSPCVYFINDSPWMEIEKKYVEKPEHALMPGQAEYFNHDDDCLDPDAK